MQAWLGGKVVFLIQMLLIFGGRCNRYYWDIRLKILRLLNFNMLFQLVLQKFSKANCFRVYRKFITCSQSCKEVIRSIWGIPGFPCFLWPGLGPRNPHPSLCVTTKPRVTRQPRLHRMIYWSFPTFWHSLLDIMTQFTVIVTSFCWIYWQNLNSP